ncbi:MAG: RNA-binding protein [Halobacteria archaeon]
MDIRSRHHLRDDEEEKIVEELREKIGADLGSYSLEEVELDEDYDLVLADGEPLLIRFEGEIFVTVQGALETNPSSEIVTVDQGAVGFLTNGADVMRPGIVDADPGIDPGDLVVVVEENHGKAIGVGRALTDGKDMMGDEGRVVENLLHVDDELWEFET